MELDGYGTDCEHLSKITLQTYLHSYCSSKAITGNLLWSRQNEKSFSKSTILTHYPFSSGVPHTSSTGRENSGTLKQPLFQWIGQNGPLTWDVGKITKAEVGGGGNKTETTYIKPSPTSQDTCSLLSPLLDWLCCVSKSWTTRLLQPLKLC